MTEKRKKKLVKYFHSTTTRSFAGTAYKFQIQISMHTCVVAEVGKTKICVHETS